ncbi:MAG: EF-P 5-aminopentanol modification-associated protein YfmF [Candidatus Fimenecus sp.]
MNIEKIIDISDGVKYRSYKTDRFKTSMFSLSFLAAEEISAAELNILNFYLVDSTNNYKTSRLLNMYLEELYGTSLSSSLTAVGDGYNFTISLDFIDNKFSLDENNLEENIRKLFFDVIFNPCMENEIFSEKNLEKAKRLAYEYVEGTLNDKRQYALSRANEIMYEGTKRGITTQEILNGIKNVTAKDAERAWKLLIEKSPMFAFSVGNIDVNSFERELTEHIKKIKRAPKLFETVIRNTPYDKKVFERLDMTQSKIVLSFTTDIKSPSDEFYKRLVANDIFGGGPYSLLFSNVREKMSLCYYCSSRFFASKGNVIVQSGIEPQNRDKLISAVLEQLEKLKQGEFSEEILSASKKAMSDIFGTVFDTPQTIMGYYGNLVYDYPLTPEEAVEQVNATTKEDVIRILNELELDIIYALEGNGETENE